MLSAFFFFAAAGAMAAPFDPAAALSSAAASARFDCPSGVDVQTLLEDLAATGRFEQTPFMPVILYQDCRALAARDESSCAALERLPPAMIVPHSFKQKPARVVMQAANHCRTALTMASLALGFKGFDRFCRGSWELPDSTGQSVICAALKKDFPSPKAVCASIAAANPRLIAPGDECVSSMASFMGEPGACETSTEALGDRQTCFWIRAARKDGALFRAQTCRAYASSSVIRLCRASGSAQALTLAAAARRAMEAAPKRDAAMISRAKALEAVLTAVAP